MGDIRIRITAKAENPEEASNLIQNMEQEIRNRLGILIYGVDTETLHGNIAKELERLTLTLSVVETFTGGIICQKLTSTGSNSFIQGEVLPSENSQRAFLGLSSEEHNSLKKDSKRFADLLAKKSRNEFKTDLGLAMFGKSVRLETEIAEKQVVATRNRGEGEYRIETYYSLSTSGGIENQEYSMGGELWMVQERTSIVALDMLRKYLKR